MTLAHVRKSICDGKRTFQLNDKKICLSALMQYVFRNDQQNNKVVPYGITLMQILSAFSHSGRGWSRMGPSPDRCDLFVPLDNGPDDCLRLADHLLLGRGVLRPESRLLHRVRILYSRMSTYLKQRVTDLDYWIEIVIFESLLTIFEEVLFFEAAGAVVKIGLNINPNHHKQILPS